MQKNLYSGIIKADATKQQIEGNNYAKFTLRVDDGKDKEGKRKSLWLDVIKLDKEGKLTPYLIKDSIVEVDGRMSVGAYINKENKAVGTITLWANELGFLSSPKKVQEATKDAPIYDDDSDLPF